MPETKIERFVLALGGCAVGLLVFLIVRAHGAGGHATATTARTPPILPAAPPSTTTTTASSPGANTAHPASARLVLTASRGDCWMIVRVASARGRTLFSGILAHGAARAFQASSLWLQLGAAGNLVARLDGKLTTIPPGTSTLAVTTKGVRRLSAG